MAYEKKRLERGCPMGTMLANKIESMDGGDSGLAGRVTDLEGKVTALETKLAAVLAATATDSTKTLKIDTDGNVELV